MTEKVLDDTALSSPGLSRPERRRFSLRYSLRALLGLIAVVAVVMGASMWLWHRSTHFQRQADYHFNQAMAYAGLIPDTDKDRAERERMMGPSGPLVIYRESHPLAESWSWYHIELSVIYESAARCPWFPRDPEPLHPKKFTLTHGSLAEFGIGPPNNQQPAP